MSQPIKKLKDFGVSTAIFEWTNNDGKKNYTISLQRSFKKKDSEEYVNETINLFPEDLLKFAKILENTYNELTKIRNGEKPSEATVISTADKGWIEIDPDPNADIPF